MIIFKCIDYSTRVELDEQAITDDLDEIDGKSEDELTAIIDQWRTEHNRTHCSS